MDENWFISFREKLEQHYAWPSLYVFKFIVPTGRQDQVKNLFPLHTVKEKLSKEGKLEGSICMDIGEHCTGTFCPICAESPAQIRVAVERITKTE